MSEALGVGNLIVVNAPRADLHASPGQFFLLTLPSFDPFLPLTIFPFRLHNSTVISLLVPRRVEAWARMDTLELRGPYGRGFALPNPGQHILVLATDVDAGAPLLAWLDLLLARGCEVTFICGGEALPERWLPPEVEYRVAENVLSAAAELWTWADAVYASGSFSFYDSLYDALLYARAPSEKFLVQILLRDLALPCGIGICFACAFKTRSGIALACQDGPALNLTEWIREE